MPDTVLLAQVSLAVDSNLPEDSVVNTFHFRGPDSSVATAITDVNTLLTTAYATIDQYLSAEFTGVATVNYYDLADPKPRAPKETLTFNFTPSAVAGSLPSEVAICLSYQAERVSGVPQARRRGRVFFGPWANSNNVLTGDPAVVALQIRTDLASFATTLANATIAAGAWYWAIYSPTIDATQSLENAAARVTNGWIDGQFDTQRRRGVESTVRTLWAGS